MLAVVDISYKVLNDLSVTQVVLNDQDTRIVIDYLAIQDTILKMDIVLLNVVKIQKSQVGLVQVLAIMEAVQVHVQHALNPYPGV